MKKNYHQYYISETGKIYLNGSPVPTKINKEGHIIANLRVDGKGKTIRVAREVCKIYMDLDETQRAVLFKNRDKTDIRLDNMKMVSTSEAGRYHARKDERQEVDLDINKISWR